ncbi:MAG: hypothetical protein KKB37_00310, partial [Alphaproteobacteria bacterium]|nr:hypothetical protein [Alphaproteobacteria bacterium]
MLQRYLSGLDADRYQSAVLSLMGPGVLDEGITRWRARIHNLGLVPGRISARGLFNLRTAMVKEQPDLIHGWMYHG